MINRICRIREYFVKEVGVPEEEGNDVKQYKNVYFFLKKKIVVAIQAHYHETYGLSLRGLTKHHNVDPLDFGR